MPRSARSSVPRRKRARSIARAQFEQPRLDAVELGGLERQRLGRLLQPLLGLARLDHRAVERRERLGEQGMLVADPVEPSRGGAKLRERGIRAVPDEPQRLEVARQLLALLHVGADKREALLLAFLGRQRSQLGEMREQQVLVGLALRDRGARRLEPYLGRAPLGPGVLDSGQVAAGITVEQRAMAARIDQAAVVVLAVQLDQRRGELAQQRRADRLVVDPRPRSAIGPDPPPQDQRLARLELDFGLRQGQPDRLRQLGELEGRGDARLLLAGAHQRSLGAIAEHQPERVEQDRLAGAGLPGQHAETRPAGEVERLDQDDVADRERGQHGRASITGGPLAAQRRTRSCPPSRRICA